MREDVILIHMKENITMAQKIWQVGLKSDGFVIVLVTIFEFSNIFYFFNYN